MRSTGTFFDDSKTKVLPSRSEQNSLDSKNEFSPDIHLPEEIIKVVDEDNEKDASDDSASAASQFKKVTSLGKRAGSSKIPADGVESQQNGDSFGVLQGNIDENPTLADINQAGGNANTSADPIQEKRGAARKNADTSADSIHDEMVAVDENTKTSEDFNQEGMMGLSDSTSQVNPGEVVDKADVPRVHSLGYEGVGFSLWEVTHALADGVLDEDRMQRLKNGLLALLVSLDN